MQATRDYTVPPAVEVPILTPQTTPPRIVPWRLPLSEAVRQAREATP